MIKLTKDKKGFTLVEIVVSIAIMVIIAFSAVFIFNSSLNGVRLANAKNEQQLIVDGVVDMISSELRYATDVTITSKVNFDGVDDDADPIGRGRERIRVQQNKIYMTAIKESGYVFNTKPFNNDDESQLVIDHDMSVKFIYEDEYNITLLVSAEDNFDNKTEVRTTVKLLNCELLQRPITVYDDSKDPNNIYDPSTETSFTPNPNGYFAVMYESE